MPSGSTSPAALKIVKLTASLEVMMTAAYLPFLRNAVSCIEYALTRPALPVDHFAKPAAQLALPRFFHCCNEIRCFLIHLSFSSIAVDSTSIH